MSAFTTVIVKISKTNTKSLTVKKKSARNLTYLVSSWIFFKFKTDVSFGFEADVVVTLALKQEINLLAAKSFVSSMSAMLFALIFPRAQRASTFDISAERNVWLQSALRSFAIVCDYMETALLAIVCDPRSFAIIWKPALKKDVKAGKNNGGKCRGRWRNQLWSKRKKKETQFFSLRNWRDYWKCLKTPWNYSVETNK